MTLEWGRGGGGEGRGAAEGEGRGGQAQVRREGLEKHGADAGERMGRTA